MTQEVYTDYEQKFYFDNYTEYDTKIDLKKFTNKVIDLIRTHPNDEELGHKIRVLYKKYKS